MPNHLKWTSPEGQTFEVAVVHHKDHEGSMMIDIRTGAIVTPLMERPEWSEGLAVALLNEHADWYTKRTGTYETPDVFYFEDLGWLGVDPESEEGDAMEVFASPEMRQDRLANFLGIDRETGDMGPVLAEVEHAFDQYRTDEEAGAIETSKDQGFSDARKLANG